MSKVGIFGGSFNPPHLGHINAVTAVAKKLGLKKVHIVPAAQNPMKVPIDGATPEQRLEMTRLAFSTYGDQFVIDDQEVKRGGKSYTIDTVKALRKDHTPDEMNVILGLDAFESIGGWKDLSKLLEETNFIVVTRPGSGLPDTLEELPEAIRPFVKDFDFNFVELKTGRSIQFIAIADIEVSGTDLRKKIRSGRNLEKLLPLPVEGYIKEHQLYKPLGEKVGDYEKFTHFCADFLNGKKSIMVRGFDLRAMQAPSEFTLVASGTSTRHASSLAENLITAVKDEYGLYPQSLEGADEGRWVLVDYGSLIVHIFYDFVRQEYRIEDLWKAGKEISLTK